MVTYSDRYEENLKRATRDVLALDPVATIAKLIETLSQCRDHLVDPPYITRLRDKSVAVNLGP